MKRELEQYGYHTGRCCPGHDKYPTESYATRTSKHARSRDKKAEHQHARTIRKRNLFNELMEGLEFLKEEKNVK